MKFTEAARKQYCVIYSIRHGESGKRYIGQTKSTAYKRFYGHRCATLAGENHPLYCAIRKYGFEAFKVGVVQVCTSDMLDEWEIVWTAALNALHPNGYSLTTGGQRARRSTEARKNMSKGRRGVVP